MLVELIVKMYRTSEYYCSMHVHMTIIGLSKEYCDGIKEVYDLMQYHIQAYC